MRLTLLGMMLGFSFLAVPAAAQTRERLIEAMAELEAMKAAQAKGEVVTDARLCRFNINVLILNYSAQGAAGVSPLALLAAFSLYLDEHGPVSMQRISEYCSNVEY